MTKIVSEGQFQDESAQSLQRTRYIQHVKRELSMHAADECVHSSPRYAALVELGTN